MVSISGCVHCGEVVLAEKKLSLSAAPCNG